jgi:uncharacterized protein YdeI (BOF family)
MKKLILSAAIILGSFSAFAQQSAPPKSEVATQTPAANTFTEIKLEEVPEAVKAALVKAYPTAILNKAFINEKKEYELQVKVGDREGSVFADANGAWIKK